MIAMCTAMMCKLRNSKVNAAQKIVSLILYGGHASKQVHNLGPIYQGTSPVHKNVYTILQIFVRLHNHGITMSYTGTLHLIGQLGENHDAKVHEWRESLLEHLQNIQVNKQHDSLNFDQVYSQRHLVFDMQTDDDGYTECTPPDTRAYASPDNDISRRESLMDQSMHIFNSDDELGEHVNISFESNCETESPTHAHQGTTAV